MDQPLIDALDIREVARRTGLTSRALRFYEARGLVKPLRTYSGRRIYGRGELERIQQICQRRKLASEAGG
jgi:DNA-binding transcriptional MerR regulator